MRVASDFLLSIVFVANALADVITVGPGGTCCPGNATIQVQALYFSHVFLMTATIDPFDQGEDLIISIVPSIVVTSLTVTSTIEDELSLQCFATATSTSSPRSSQNSAAVSANPALETATTRSSAQSISTTISRRNSASTSASSTTPISTTALSPTLVLTTLRSSDTTSASPSSTPEPTFFLAFNAMLVPDPFRRGELKPAAKRQDSSPQDEDSTPAVVIDLTPIPIVLNATNIVLPGQCNNATAFTLEDGRLSQAGTDGAIGKAFGATEAPLEIPDADVMDIVNTTFAVSDGMLTWMASDGTGAAQFFACPDGVFAGFPIISRADCRPVQLSLYSINRCVSQRSSTTSTADRSTVSSRITSSSSMTSSTLVTPTIEIATSVSSSIYSSDSSSSSASAAATSSATTVTIESRTATATSSMTSASTSTSAISPLSRSPTIVPEPSTMTEAIVTPASSSPSPSAPGTSSTAPAGTSVSYANSTQPPLTVARKRNPSATRKSRRAAAKEAAKANEVALEQEAATIHTATFIFNQHRRRFDGVRTVKIVRTLEQAKKIHKESELVNCAVQAVRTGIKKSHNGATSSDESSGASDNENEDYVDDVTELEDLQGHILIFKLRGSRGRGWYPFSKDNSTKAVGELAKAAKNGKADEKIRFRVYLGRPEHARRARAALKTNVP
ncbi:uncharacterized protein AB675_4569 [Cyphellophora attinorum]|uniref:Uncharacterized protein n=1 Tax=Cyphellophora attinorum TaxID=1664694 RepID=A0A0N0NLF7_9EURO|nr:uncharacterized protein AB675_4569 [Phialophora attinorum]KPI39118.1 hypothetical protein AB675_4569 [Phialophora attinorum]